jgi:hypothetical protein
MMPYSSLLLMGFEMLKWLRYSGVSVTITMNPAHWAWRPRAGQVFTTEWAGPNERTWHARFLFVTVRVWIDDGSW